MKDRDGNKPAFIAGAKDAVARLQSSCGDVTTSDGKAICNSGKVAQFVAGEVTAEMSSRVANSYFGVDTPANMSDMLEVLRYWQRELGPALGLVEIREPGREDCIAITKEHGRLRSERAGQLVQASVSAGMMREGRDMFAAVSKWLKGEL